MGGYTYHKSRSNECNERRGRPARVHCTRDQDKWQWSTAYRSGAFHRSRRRSRHSNPNPDAVFVAALVFAVFAVSALVFALLHIRIAPRAYQDPDRPRRRGILICPG